MNRVANLRRKEREELFIATALDVNLPETMAEKDFWICWVLDYLFHISPWARQIVFKGGTSLSKCFALIDRFSEDIDIILDWRVLGYAKDEPWAERSRTKQDKFSEEVNTKTEAFLQTEFLPRVQNDFSHLLSDEYELFIVDIEPQTICFSYPQVFGTDSVFAIVRMEIGALAAWTPAENATITPYAAQYYPKLFIAPSTQIQTVSPERTFWEKATILHKEAFRTDGKIPPRYSRHYYDLYCMGNSQVKDRAYANFKLLESVSKFKKHFYPSQSAHYELAFSGALKLMPVDENIPALKADYEHMKNMIFGKQPEFDDILSGLQKMEHEINKEKL